MRHVSTILAFIVAAALCACGGTGTSTPGTQTLASSSPAPITAQSNCRGTTASNAAAGTTPTTPAMSVPAGYVIQTIAQVPTARELAALPNGDLLVATLTSSLYIVPNAESAGAAGAPQLFATMPDRLAAGITFVPSSCTVFVGTNTGVYAMAYADGMLSVPTSSIMQVAQVRTGSVAPNSDGDVHTLTSVAFTNGSLYVSVGSSCNACTEVDPTRAVILQMHPDGSNVVTKATRIRNATALTVNPQTGTLWAGDAGQDGLPLGHPYEFADAVTLHGGTADYGWPECEENHMAYTANTNCSNTVAPRVELPAYSTILGATFYPASAIGTYAFDASYRGGLFLTAHGSWHQVNGTYYSAPRVAFVAMNADTPRTAVNWSDPTAQWMQFVGGFQLSDGVTRIGRPTGIAVGSQGSLFVADDQNGVVYRIRPVASQAAAQRQKP